MGVLAVNAVSLAVDQKPINVYEPNGGGGIPCRMSNPRVWKIAFTTNGTLPVRQIVVRACDNLIARMQSVQDLLHSIESKRDEYVLVIPGEDHTIGNLLMKTITDMYPDIDAVTYSKGEGRVCNVRIRCDEDINTIYVTAIKRVIQIYTEIKRGIV